jgi:dienelactone hydrolase
VAPRTQESTVAPPLSAWSDSMLAGPASLAPLYAVKVRTEQFVDTSRKVGTNGSVPGQAQRPLPTLVIEPQPQRAGQRFPLLVFGHGLGGEPAEYQALLVAVAARGYVVAAPTFPLTNKRTPGGANLLDEPNQPADMKFVINSMLASSNASSAVVDPTKVAVAGHSLGAITTIDMIGNSCCYDRRVKAAVAIAGSLNVFRPGKLFGSPATPVLFIHGDRDGTVPYALGYSTYQAAKAPKHFLTVLGGGHVFDLQGVAGSRATVAPLVADAMVRFLDAQLGGKGSAAVKGALGDEVKQNPTLLRYESVAK